MSSSRPSPNAVVRRFAPDEWRLYRTLRLAALEESPDAFATTLSRERQLTDEEWAARLSRGASSPRELPVVVELNGEPAGLAWVRLRDDGQVTEAHLYHMWVAPQHRRHGAGRVLVDAAIAWARRLGAGVMLLDVTAGNGAAARLYEAAGFEATGIVEPLRPGSDLQSRAMRLVLDSRTTLGMPSNDGK
jgi:ribosomal protein S18 acetylase RimI-like enzyme